MRGVAGKRLSHSAPSARAGLAGNDQAQAEANEEGAGQAVEPAAEARLALQALPGGPGEMAEQRENERCLQCEDEAEGRHLPSDAALSRKHELRQESQEEERHLGIDRVGQHAAPEQLARRFARAVGGARRAAGMAPGLDAEPQQVEAAARLEQREGERRRGEQRADPEHGERRVAQAADRAAETEGDAVTAAARHPDAEYHQVVGAGSEGDQEGGEQEGAELFRAEHGAMIAGAGARGQPDRRLSAGPRGRRGGPAGGAAGGARRPAGKSRNAAAARYRASRRRASCRRRTSPGARRRAGCAVPR